MESLRLYVNDVLVEERDVPPTTTLLRYLRDRLQLSGTKEGCAEGDCGACTVVVADVRADGTPTYRAVNSCLVLLPMVQGRRVYTVEALKANGAYHLVQESMARHLGSQCGYCTPGVVMSLVEAAYRDDLSDDWQIDDQLCGNLCRCTGYRPIRDAAKEVAGRCPNDALAERLRAPRDSMQLAYAHGAQRYFNPATLAELFDVVDAHPSARFVCGGTDLSLEITKRFREPELLVSVEAIPELRKVDARDDGWDIGAAVTLTGLQEALGGEVMPLEKMLRFFASRQIKNRATVGGNLCNASPIGDLAPVLLALGAELSLVSRRGTRRIGIDDFFLGYRKTALEPGEILATIHLPRLPADARASSFKVSKRRELDISAVAMGALVRLSADGVVTEARLGYGGLAATPARARQTEAALVGRVWCEETVRAAMDAIDLDFQPISDHRASAWYRTRVAKNLLVGFYFETKDGPVALDPRPTATIHLRAGGVS